MTRTFHSSLHSACIFYETAIVYGQAEADRRHDARSAFLESIAVDPKAAAQIADDSARARRQIFGADQAP